MMRKCRQLMEVEEKSRRLKTRGARNTLQQRVWEKKVRTQANAGEVHPKQAPQDQHVIFYPYDPLPPALPSCTPCNAPCLAQK